jgi:hypothetical protein
MNCEPQRQDFSRLIQTGLFLVAVISIACAIARGFLKTVVIDEKTAMFLALGVVALVIHQITKFKGFGIEFEKAVEQIVYSRTKTIKEDVENVGVSVVKLEGCWPRQQSRNCSSSSSSS